MNGMSVVPHGDWKFHQRLPNGGFKTFVGLSEDDLFKQVRQFRLNNNIDLGNLEFEIKQGISGPSHKVNEAGYSLRERVTHWKMNRYNQRLSFVDQDEAERRAAICADCPYNKVDYADSCAECHAGVERDLYAMRQGRSTEYRLGACAITGQPNHTAVHLTEAGLKHRIRYTEALRERHPSCWLLTLDEQADRGVG
jgi:hypothetical protein